MTLATVDADGAPDARIVLLKGVDDGGFVFYTNLDSAKGRRLAADPHAALLFHWKSLHRQVRVRGQVSRVTDAEADAYFATRARASPDGTWASLQSQPLESPLALEAAVARFGVKFGLGGIPRPPHWSGLRLAPVPWSSRRSRHFRLHERLVFQRDSVAGAWHLQPASIPSKGSPSPAPGPGGPVRVTWPVHSSSIRWASADCAAAGSAVDRASASSRRNHVADAAAPLGHLIEDVGLRAPGGAAARRARPLPPADRGSATAAKSRGRQPCPGWRNSRPCRRLAG